MSVQRPTVHEHEVHLGALVITHRIDAVLGSWWFIVSTRTLDFGQGPALHVALGHFAMSVWERWLLWRDHEKRR